METTNLKAIPDFNGLKKLKLTNVGELEKQND